MCERYRKQNDEVVCLKNGNIKSKPEKPASNSMYFAVRQRTWSLVTGSFLSPRSPTPRFLLTHVYSSYLAQYKFHSQLQAGQSNLKTFDATGRH